MGLRHSPKIVTDGLILAVDAANTRSYPGTGTTLSDQSTGKHTGTLFNSTGYESSNGGAFTFNGSNQYIRFPSVAKIGYQNSTATVEVAFDLSSGSGGFLVTNARESSGFGHGWYYCSNTQCYFSMHSKGSSPYEYKCIASSTAFSHVNTTGLNLISFSVDIGSTSMDCTFNINGYSETITNNSLGFQINGQEPNQLAIDIGRFYNHTYGQSYSDIKISTVKAYNRNLSVAEQNQNYNALKGRFGL
jgi:hypothetical protein